MNKRRTKRDRQNAPVDENEDLARQVEWLNRESERLDAEIERLRHANLREEQRLKRVKQKLGIVTAVNAACAENFRRYLSGELDYHGWMKACFPLRTNATRRQLEAAKIKLISARLDDPTIRQAFRESLRDAISRHGGLDDSSLNSMLLEAYMLGQIDHVIEVEGQRRRANQLKSADSKSAAITNDYLDLIQAFDNAVAVDLAAFLEVERHGRKSQRSFEAASKAIRRRLNKDTS